MAIFSPIDSADGTCNNGCFITGQGPCTAGNINCDNQKTAANSPPSSWNCPEPKPMPFKDQAIQAASILKAMNVGQCQNSTFAAGGFSLLDLAGGFAESSDSIGCEQVSVITDSYNSQFTALDCAMTQITQSQNMSYFGVNNVEIGASGNSKMFCGHGGLVINQDINLKMFVTGQFTGTVQDSTTNNVQNFIQAIQDSMLKADVGWGATPQGQRAISQVQAQIQNYMNTTDLSLTTQSVMEKFYTGNNITVTLSDNAVIDASECKFTQDGTYNLVVQNVFTTTITNVQSNTALNKFIAQQSNSLSSTAAGFSLGSFGIIIIVLIVIGVFIFGAPLILGKKISKTSATMLFILLLLSGGLTLFFYLRNETILYYIMLALTIVLLVLFVSACIKAHNQNKAAKASAAAKPPATAPSAASATPTTAATATVAETAKPS